MICNVLNKDQSNMVVDIGERGLNNMTKYGKGYIILYNIPFHGYN